MLILNSIISYFEFNINRYINDNKQILSKVECLNINDTQNRVNITINLNVPNSQS